MAVTIKQVKITKPADVNVIFGQAHFIKTVEDIHEALVAAVPGIRFGLAFCEASGPALIRLSGTDQTLVKLARDNAKKIACGHSFLLFMKDAYPINVLSQLHHVNEVVTLFCATANPVEILIGETTAGRAVMGVVDGLASRGVESDQQQRERKKLLRDMGYKL